MLSDDERDEYEERVAIIIEGSQVAPHEAQQIALARVLRKRQKELKTQPGALPEVDF